MNRFDLVKFTDNDFELDGRVDVEHETIWLTQDEIAILFEKSVAVIFRHITNIFKDGVLEKTSLQKMQKSPNANNSSYRPPIHYNLDVIISVGYHVKSQRGVLFRRWANKVLEDHLIKGLKHETVWLTQEEMAVLFDTARSSITYHINKFFSSEELDKNTSVE